MHCDDCEDVEEISCDMPDPELLQPGQAQPSEPQEAAAKLLAEIET